MKLVKMLEVVKLEKSSIGALLLFSMVLFFIIVLPNTIALRNILLFLGFCISAILIKKNIPILLRARFSITLLLFPVLIFLWVILHYYFFSLNPLDQWHEIKSLWLRSFLAFFFGFGLAISISKYQNFRRIIYLNFFFVPLINIAVYLYFSIKLGHLAPPSSYLRYLFTKIELAYFGSLASAVLLAEFIEFARRKDVEKRMWVLLLIVAGLVLILISNLIADSRIGAIIWALVIVLMSMYSLRVFAISGVKKGMHYLLLAIAIMAIFITFLNINSRISQRTWNIGFIYDVLTGLDIKGNPQWSLGEGNAILPKNSEGEMVNSSTYHRVAWAVAGIYLIAEHPLGYGVIKNSFTGLLDASGIPHGGLGQTHSGWVDFGLAYGLPGILLLLTWILAITYFATKDLDALNILAISIAIIYIPLMLIAETAWKEYLEAEFLILALASGLVLMRSYRT